VQIGFVVFMVVQFFMGLSVAGIRPGVCQQAVNTTGLLLHCAAMLLTPIVVECYAGEKADETPRCFSLQGQTIEVAEVLDRWYQVESLPEWPRADYFKVRGDDGNDYLLKHDLESDDWYLGRKWERVRSRLQRVLGRVLGRFTVRIQAAITAAQQEHQVKHGQGSQAPDKDALELLLAHGWSLGRDRPRVAGHARQRAGRRPGYRSQPSPALSQFIVHREAAYRLVH
jgi:hypothetical protein